MAGGAQDNPWPLPKFDFSVQVGDDVKNVSFQEVNGLESEAQIIEYRRGNSRSFYPIKMPGMLRPGNVTMRKGVFAKDSEFFTWCGEIKLNTIKPRTVVIRLLDESGNPRMTWTLNNAWPTKVAGTDLNAEDDEVTVESVEMVYESLVAKAT